MTNPFYTRTFDVLPGTVISSQAIENQFQSVEAGFDGVNTATGTTLPASIALKATKAGDTYTGTHNFSGATLVSLPANTTIAGVSAAEVAYLDNVTSPIQTQLDSKAGLASPAFTGVPTAPTATTGTNTTQIATTAFVQQAAFASAANLPGDPGDAVYRALSTYSGTKSWSTVSALGASTPSANETLTNKRISSFHYIDYMVTNAAATGAITLDLANGSIFDLTLTGNVTGITISNAPALSGQTMSFLVRVRQGSTAYTLTWFSGITWLTSGGSAPVLPAANGITEYLFSTSAAGAYLGRKGAST